MALSTLQLGNSRHSRAERRINWSEILPQKRFERDLLNEQRRTERSRRPFVLMLLEPRTTADRLGSEDCVERVFATLVQAVRSTDILGWHRDERAIGAIFTELGTAEAGNVATTLRGRLTTSLGKSLSVEEINDLSMSFYTFPEDWSDSSLRPKSPFGGSPGPELEDTVSAKRAIDIAGSLFGLALLAPLLAAIALSVKLTSTGPVIYRQRRLGRYGRAFTFLKFRSMYEVNDDQEHREYMEKFIKGDSSIDQRGPGDNQPLFKIAKDARVTPVGRLLRRTSLDELPQLFNVLKGDMSLVGPRPPVPYEVTHYDIWQRRRLMEVKPGITGLWQVKGRSRVGFADMVRLDLEYARSRSFWADLRILAQTPWAVMKGDGAC